MTVFDLLLTNLAVVMVPALLLWIVSVFIHDVSIVDIAWGPLFAIIAWATFVATEPRGWHPIMVTGCVTVWATRLAVYLAWRNLGKGEDYRYQSMRERIGPSFRWLSVFMVFGLQAMLAWIVAFPVQLGIAHPGAEGITPLVVIGAACFLVGLFFETIGDWQLARFKADPSNRGEVMDRGLWRYTRHPNYFGDFMVWWGLFAISLYSLERASTMGWTVVGPILMSILLLRVSGVALLERSMEERRPGYRDYVRRTSAFFPWPPKDESEDDESE